MIPQAKLTTNYFGESRQECKCGAKHPTYYKQCWSCGRGMPAFKTDWNKIDGVNITQEMAGD